MLGVFAEFERALIVERILAGLERKAARGGWCGGRRPYGLDIAADRDHLERNPTEAPLIPVMFDLYVNRQLGSTALAKWLNSNGYRTKTGRPWNRMRSAWSQLQACSELPFSCLVLPSGCLAAGVPCRIALRRLRKSRKNR
jgi:DNA invertase Pin-like site-specific DNA recombinase